MGRVYKVIRNENGLGYKVEYREEFKDIEKDLPGKLKKAFGTEQFHYDSMTIWKPNLKGRYKHLLSVLNGLSDELRKFDQSETKFFDPDEFWFIFDVEITNNDVQNLTKIFSDQHTWTDEVEAAKIIFYSPPPSFPVDFIMLEKDFIKCSGSETTASSLATLVEDYLQAHGHSYSIKAVIVECLYRSSIYHKTIHPFEDESKFLRDTEIGLKEFEGYVGAINSKI